MTPSIKYAAVLVRFGEQCLTACGLSPFVCRDEPDLGGLVQFSSHCLCQLQARRASLPITGGVISIFDLTQRVSHHYRVVDSFKDHIIISFILQQSSDVVFWNYLLAFTDKEMEAHRGKVICSVKKD